MRPGPFIVLEGPDGVGKTTLAEEIVKYTGWPIIHSGPPDQLAANEWIAKTLVDGPAVFDRLHLGSVAYGGAFRNMFDVTDHENWYIEGWLKSRGCLIIHCDVPKEVQDRNLSRGPDNADAVIYEDATKRDLVRSLYDNYFAGKLEVKPNIVPMRYDFTQDSMGLIARAAVEFVWHREQWTPWSICSGNSINPALVLIGDEPHGLTKLRQRARKEGFDPEVVRERFFRGRRPHTYVTFGGQSGRYLHMCFRMAKLSLENTLIVNSSTWDGARPLEEDVRLREAIRRARRVVALGNKAAERARRADIEVHTKIPHPQYWKRFRYKEQHVYAELLNGSMELSDVPEPSFSLLR